MEVGTTRPYPTRPLLTRSHNRKLKTSTVHTHLLSEAPLTLGSSHNSLPQGSTWIFRNDCTVVVRPWAAQDMRFLLLASSELGRGPGGIYSYGALLPICLGSRFPYQPLRLLGYQDGTLDPKPKNPRPQTLNPHKPFQRAEGPTRFRKTKGVLYMMAPFGAWLRLWGLGFKGFGFRA